jgi:hypothetical protein
MDIKTYLKSSTPEERQALADKVGAKISYFSQLSGGHRKPSSKLCKALVKHEPRLTLADLRPDIWSLS